MTPEEADEKAAELLPAEILSGLVDSNWKNRLSAAERFLGSLDGIESKVGNAQALAKILCKQPGLSKRDKLPSVEIETGSVGRDHRKIRNDHHNC